MLFFFAKLLIFGMEIAFILDKITTFANTKLFWNDGTDLRKEER